MARPGRQERNRADRSFRQLRGFHHGINQNKVFGTHSRCRWRASNRNTMRGLLFAAIAAIALMASANAEDDPDVLRYPAPKLHPENMPETKKAFGARSISASAP